MSVVKNSSSELVSLLSWDDYVKALEAHGLKLRKLESTKGFKLLFRLHCWRKRLVLLEVGWPTDKHMQFVVEQQQSVRVEWSPWQSEDGSNKEFRYLQVRQNSICRPESGVVLCELEAIAQYMQLSKYENRSKSNV